MEPGGARQSWLVQGHVCISSWELPAINSETWMEGTAAGTGRSRRKDLGPLDDLTKPPTVPAPAVSLHAIHQDDRNQATSIWPVFFGSLLIAFCAPFIPPPSQAIPPEPTPAACLVSSMDPPLQSLPPPSVIS